MMALKRPANLILAGIFLMSLAACGPQNKPLPTAMVVVHTPGSIPTASPQPTQGQPGATAAPATVTTAPAATDAPAPTAQATEPPMYGPDVYPEGINPLTGEAADPALLNRMPVAIKVSNFPRTVRPQSGLSQADLVIEHLAEAGLTRFTAIFLQRDADKVGAVRSARFIDAELAENFQAILAASGMSLGTMGHLKGHPYFVGDNVWRLVSLETHYGCPPLCSEIPNDINGLFPSTTAIRQATEPRGSGVKSNLTGLAFSERLPAGGVAVTELNIDFSNGAHVSWRYAAEVGRYTRWQEQDETGAMITHIDEAQGLPITAVNMVVLWVPQVNNYVPEDTGSCGLEIQLWGTGLLQVFRDGQAFAGRWRRDGSTGMRLRLETESGDPLPLRPGNSWIEIVTTNARTSLVGATFLVTNRVPDTMSLCPIDPTMTPEVTATAAP
jgi:hypothetical protein